MGEKPELHSRQALRGAGYSDVEVRQLLRAGELTPVRRGTYVRGGLPDHGRARHVVAARAAVDRLADGAVCSHVTAAVLHGLPVWRIPLQRVHVTRARRTGGRCGARIHVHSAPLDPNEIDTVAGIPVTGLARTLVDLGRTVPFEEAVAVADAALAGDAGWCADDAGWRGTEARPDRRPLDAAALKYGRLLRPGQEPGDVVFEEKLREDRLRDLGLAVVRWTWADLANFTEVAHRLDHHLLR